MTTNYCLTRAEGGSRTYNLEAREVDAHEWIWVGRVVLDTPIRVARGVVPAQTIGRIAARLDEIRDRKVYFLMADGKGLDR